MLEDRLSVNPYLAGDAYSVADMMIVSWAKGGLGFLEKAAADRLPPLGNVRRWLAEIEARPAVARALSRISKLFWLASWPQGQALLSTCQGSLAPDLSPLRSKGR